MVKATRYLVVKVVIEHNGNDEQTSEVVDAVATELDYDVQFKSTVDIDQKDISVTITDSEIIGMTDSRPLDC